MNTQPVTRTHPQRQTIKSIKEAANIIKKLSNNPDAVAQDKRISALAEMIINLANNLTPQVTLKRN